MKCGIILHVLKDLDKFLDKLESDRIAGDKKVHCFCALGRFCIVYRYRHYAVPKTLTSPPPPCPTCAPPEGSPRPPLGSSLAPDLPHLRSLCSGEHQSPSTIFPWPRPSSGPLPRRPHAPPVAAETTCDRPDPCGPRSGPLGFQTPLPPTRGCTAFPSASTTGSSPLQPSPAAATPPGSLNPRGSG
uniref:Uncharacterized protein n=1 Tax=Ananas comosus var. bracteatus TaxID=296719 RepID=A0A6V7PS96_ANACO|nr:unnamed protein product [Ananas comosus var. bracteatus]